MIRLLPLLLLLSACGVDGPPVPPREAETAVRPGLTVSGSVGAGISRRF